MADIRERVQEDQGLLKKIQNFVPGFRGYRRKEDLRDADRMLRMQLSQKLGLQQRSLEDCRALITKTYGSKPLEVLGALISQMKMVQGQVTHAEMGYSGIAADIQIKEDELNRLYEYDAGLIGDVSVMAQLIDQLRGALASQDDSKSLLALSDIKGKVTEFQDLFNRRMTVIEGTEV